MGLIPFYMSYSASWQLVYTTPLSNRCVFDIVLGPQLKSWVVLYF